MFGRLPSLSALRAFEAAARLGSFKRAAGELFVTPTAVSYQIRALEEELGASLFVRKTRRVELTDVGRALAPAMTRGLLEIRTALEDTVATASVVTLSTTPAFAALRLVPRLPGLYATHPELRVKLDTSTHVVDLRRDRDIDLVIRYGRGPYRDLFNQPLMSEFFCALAAPGRFDDADIGAGVPLLETRWQQPVLGDVRWSHWFAAAGRAVPASASIIPFDDELHVLHAAVAGQGIALASSVLAADFVARELLAPLRRDVVLSGATYTAMSLPERAEARALRLVLDWLAVEFAA